MRHGAIGCGKASSGMAGLARRVSVWYGTLLFGMVGQGFNFKEV